MKKNLLFWCPFLSNVGTISATLKSAEALSHSNKFNCKIINVFGEFDDYSQIFKRKKIKEIKLIKNRFIKKIPKEGFFWSRLNYLLIFIFALFPLFFYLKKNNKDILFVYLLSSLPFFVISVFKLSNKIIFRISGKVKYNFLRKKIWSIANDSILNVLIQTSFAKKQLIRENIFNLDKIIYLVDPIINLKKINKLKKIKIQKKFLNKQFYVAVGRLTRQKNFLFLISAIEIILKKRNLNLLILGEGEQRQELENLIKEKKLENRVFLVGFKKNIFSYIHKSEGLICSSLWEEPGFIIQEAAACKKIILTSNCQSGPAEFLEFGKNGFIFLSGNHKSFKNNFSKMIRKRKLHRKMIENNMRKINNYSEKNFQKKIYNLLNFTNNF
ncbi:glycosyltransferase [Candidatus Pelagibacter communis]|uniref:glycosyltransferase n=1 Tax=Pelagibacter ubique TaxID=198252 RepID=UPI00094D0C11|nr:glycosyltransferase [Candidatus Pelagibacter ubique]